MDNKYKILYLEIHTWAGTSLGAIHYYGRLKIYDKKAEYGKTEMDVERPIDKEEADFLNDKDSATSVSMRYKAGELTNRFNDPDDIIKEAKRIWKKEFPKAEVLIEGEIGVVQPQKIIDYDDKWKNKVEEAQKLYKEFVDLGEWEIEANDPQTTKIDKAWQKVMNL